MKPSVIIEVSFRNLDRSLLKGLDLFFLVRSWTEYVDLFSTIAGELLFADLVDESS